MGDIQKNSHIPFLRPNSTTLASCYLFEKKCGAHNE